MEVIIPTPSDFSFLETIRAHGWPRLLPFTWLEETQILERVENFTDDQTVVMTLSAAENGLTVTADHAVKEAELTDKVRRLLQLDLPLGEFYKFCAAYPKLGPIPAQKQGRMLCSPTVWEDCCKVILTTNTTWTQTIAMVARMVNEFGSPLPSDPSRHAFPTPAQIAAVPSEEFAERAKLGYRAGAVHSLASDIHAGRTDLEILRDPTLETQTLWKQLLALRGVGPYAAACLLLYLGRPERVNVDSWARMMLSKEFGRAVTDQEVHLFFEPYGEWRGLVYNFYPWKQV